MAAVRRRLVRAGRRAIVPRHREVCIRDLLEIVDQIDAMLRGNTTSKDVDAIVAAGTGRLPVRRFLHVTGELPKEAPDELLGSPILEVVEVDGAAGDGLEETELAGPSVVEQSDGGELLGERVRVGSRWGPGK